MMGLAILGAFALYLLISAGVVTFAVKSAKKQGGKPWVWGSVTALVMYLLVFWDHIPTLVMHKYYCATEAGFWVYKTPEQWVKENPGVMETLVENNSSPEGVSPSWPTERRGNASVATINARFGMAYIDHFSSAEEKELPINIWRWETQLMDQKTGEVIAKQINFSTGDGRIGGEIKGKFWLQIDRCSDDFENSKKFYEFLKQYKGRRK